MSSRASPPAREEAPAEGAGDLPARDPEWVAKKEELLSWTGSAFLAGEKMSKAENLRHKGDLYGFLCGLLGWMESGAEDSAALSSLRARTSEAAREAVAEIVLFGGNLKEVAWAKGKMPPVGSKLYTHPAPATADKLRVAVEALEFFKWARNFFWCEEGSEIDGGDFQDAAERIGLIVKVPFDPDRHTDNGYGLEAGDDWFETAPHIAQALATLNEQPQ